MDRHIHLAREKRSFDFGSKYSLSACARLNDVWRIAACGDDFGLDCHTRMNRSNSFLDQKGLCARQFAAACAQDNPFEHRMNLTRDALQGSSPKAEKRVAHFR
jgi:hypothetical protein